MPMSTSPDTVATFTETPGLGEGSSSTVTGRITKSTTLGVGSARPAVSIAYTANVWAPASSSGVVKGDVQGSKGPESRLHANRDPGLSDEKANVGVWSVVGRVGPAVMLVSGTVRSIDSNAPMLQPFPSGRANPR